MKGVRGYYVFLSMLFLTEGLAKEGPSVRASSVTTPSLIRSHGYPVEEYKVQTSDGYILTMHRIPHSSKTSKMDSQAPIAFLMHGLLCSSSDWVLNGPGSALAYSLSDAGYDVWMGNARGNTYSRKHAQKSTLLQPFWNFDWHDIALYDLPAMIDYILYWTGQKDLRYFGHSQGTTTFFVLNSMVPRFNSRIKSAHLFAPVAYMNNMASPLAKIGGPLLGQPNAFNELFGSMEFLPNTKAMELMGSLACSDASITQSICTNSLFLMAGWDSPFLNETMIPLIMSTTPAGCSINQIQHYLQEYNSGYFRQYDYGYLRNKKEYGSRSPLEYYVKNIRVPMYLYYSDNDYMAHIIDVQRLIQNLNPSAFKRAHMMPTKWNHFDFLWGKNVKELLYDIVLEDIKTS